MRTKGRTIKFDNTAYNMKPIIQRSKENAFKQVPT